MSECTCYLINGKYCNKCDPERTMQYLIKENTELQKKLDAMTKAAKSVIDRWDSPVWKDHKHTGEYIHSLRQAVKAATGV